MVGRFLSCVAPQAGNIYRDIWLKKEFHISYTSYVSSFFSFTWIDTCLDLVYAVSVILLVAPAMKLGSVNGVAVLTGLLVLLTAGPPVTAQLLEHVSFRNAYLGWLHGKLTEMLTTSAGSVADGRYISAIVLTGIAGFVNSVFLVKLCFLALNIPVSLPLIALYYVGMKVTTAVIITPGNIGVREIVLGAMCAQTGVGMAEGIFASGILRVIGTAIVLIIGACFGGVAVLRDRSQLLTADQ